MDHAHAVEEPKRDVTWSVGFAMAAGIVGMWTSLVGALMPSEGVLVTGALLGLLGIVLAVGAVGFGAINGNGARGWLVAVATGSLAGLLWLVASPNI